MKQVVVTGASTGIGWGIAKILSARGFRVFGSVRRAEDGARLEAEFGPNFKALQFDVTDEASVAKGVEIVAQALGSDCLFGLVNNAGISVPGPLLHLPIPDFRRQIETNLTGQLIVTQAFAPLLGGDAGRQGRKGRILMISSVGGRRAFPFLGAYHASKFALEGLSESLRRELILFGIDVIIIAPGAVVTKIWDKAEALDTSLFDRTAFGPSVIHLRRTMLKMAKSGLSPERLGELAHHALTTAAPKTRYEISPQPMVEWVLDKVPKRVLDRLIAGRLGLRRH